MSLLTVVLICTISITEAQFPSSCSYNESGDVRLYNTVTDDNGDGALQFCYSGTWYSVCDDYWDCSVGNVACYQLGYDKAREVVYDSDDYFGYWSYNRYYYYSCSGDEHSLESCTSYYYGDCNPSYDAAGVRCVQSSDSSCSSNGTLRLVGGQSSHEGVLEYCYYGKWSPFCYLDDEEASVACKQMGYSQYAAFLSPDEYIWDINTTYTGSLFNYLSCSTYGTENTLSSCTIYSTSSSSCGVSCTHPRAIKCYERSCIDGQVRLVNGSIAQTGRVEVCVDGVWGSVCDVGWTKSDAFVVCKQLGYVNSEPLIYTNSKYGKGDVPIVYYNVNCNGWEKTLTECTKTNYLYFTCSNTAGVLCPDDCVEGEVRLVGGDTDSEGTIEVCTNSVWGLITDAGWDENDAHVVCRQLNLPVNGSIPLLNSYYGKPDRAIHYSYILCNGDEPLITSCNKIIHSLEEGRQIYNEAEVAGVACHQASPTPEPTEEVCLPKPVGTGDMCVSGDIQLDEDGVLEYCVNGRWSVFCQLTHSEATVACRQLGHVTYTSGLPFEIKQSSSSTADKSLFEMITCTSSEKSLSDCNIQEGDCMKYCSTVMGLKCFVPEDCMDGSVQLVDGIEQGGRVEVCVNGVWGSVCGEGWDKTDALVVCKQMGFPDLEPIAYSGDEFGVSTGPVVYSNVDCGGWENYLIECQKNNYLEITCSYATVAGVLCADDCSDGDIRLVGGETRSEGTVEICFDSLWGLIDESGWGIADAIVICHELGFHESTADALLHSYYGKPNKAIHIGDVECDGTEDKLTECTMKSYSLKDGKNLQDNVDVAGVSCILSSSNNFTSSILRPDQSKIFIVSSSSVQPHSSQTSTPLCVVSIVLVCLLFILILVLCIGFVIYRKRKYLKKMKLRRQLPVAMSNIFGEEYSSLHSSDEEEESCKRTDKEDFHTTGDNPDNSYQDDPTFKDDDSEHIYEYAQPQS